MSLYRDALDLLRRHGIEDPDPDIRLLAAFASGRPLRTALGSPFPDDLTGKAREKFLRLLERRARERLPTAYLVGTAEFMGLEFRVTPAVLIPRPSTETLAERALPRPGRFLEIGTGSGAVAIVLARSGGFGVATDLSEEALEVARDNAERHGVSGRISFVRADLFTDGTFDLVITNPPYVATGEFQDLSPEVLHEPRLALDGGPDGLEVIRRIVTGARARTPRLLLECAPHQAATVRDLALGAEFRTVRIHRDLDGFDRVVEALA